MKLEDEVEGVEGAEEGAEEGAGEGAAAQE